MSEQSINEINELSLASKNDLCDQAISPPSVINSEHTMEEINVGKNKKGEMSDFSWIIQQGLQNARRQSQQERARSQFMSLYTRNIDFLIQQTNQMSFLVSCQLLEVEEAELRDRSLQLLEKLKEMKERIRSEGNARRNSKTNNIVNINRKKSELAYYLTKQKGNVYRSRERTERRSVSTQKKTSNEALRSQEAIKKQKQLLLNRISIIKESISISKQTTKQRVQKFEWENNLIKEQIHLTAIEIEDMKKKPSKKQNNEYYPKTDYFSKNFKKIMNEKCLGIRRSSLLSRKKSQNTIQPNFTKNKVRIRSSGQKDCRKYKIAQCTARDQYFEKNRPLKAPLNEDNMLVETEYF